MPALLPSSFTLKQHHSFIIQSFGQSWSDLHLNTNDNITTHLSLILVASINPQVHILYFFLATHSKLVLWERSQVKIGVGFYHSSYPAPRPWRTPNQFVSCRRFHTSVCAVLLITSTIEEEEERRRRICQPLKCSKI